MTQQLCCPCIELLLLTPQVLQRQRAIVNETLFILGRTAVGQQVDG